MNYAKLKEELQRDEGVILQAYKDTADKWTIGVGHLLGETQRMTNITKAECDALLGLDIGEAMFLAHEVVPSFETLDDVRQRAIVNMAFNRGGHMRTSTSIVPAINAAAAGIGSWEDVKDMILASPWAIQVGGRANRLAQMLATGQEA